MAGIRVLFEIKGLSPAQQTTLANSIKVAITQARAIPGMTVVVADLTTYDEVLTQVQVPQNGVYTQL